MYDKYSNKASKGSCYLGLFGWFVPSVRRNIFCVLSAHVKHSDSKFESTTLALIFLMKKITVGNRRSGSLYFESILWQKTQQ